MTGYVGAVNAACVIRRRPDIPAILLLAVAAAMLRMWGSLGQPLWLDEAYSAYAAAKGWGFLWHVVPLYETHPPFYYSLVRAWTLVFGTSLGGLRSLGFTAGLATLPALWLAAREAARLAGADERWAPLAAVLLGALAPTLIEMSREVRPYPVLILVYAATIGCLLRTARGIRDDGRLPRGAWGGYVAGLALMLWLHNLGPLYAAALGLAAVLLAARRGLGLREWGLFLGGHALAALIYLPAFLILLDQAPTWVASTWLTFAWPGMEWKLALLWGVVPGVPTLLAGLVVAGLGLWRLARAPDGWRVAGALVALAGVPVAASLALSVWVSPVFIMRTMTPVTVPALLLLAVGLGGQRGLWRTVALGGGLLLASQMAIYDVKARRSGPPQDWYRALRWLAPRFRPGDMVYSYPNESALPFDHAVRDQGLAMPDRPIPTAVPSFGVGGWHPTGSRGVVSLHRRQLEAIAAHPKTQRVPTVWLLRLGPWAYDKHDMFLHALERDRRVVGVYRDGPIDIVGLRKLP